MPNVSNEMLSSQMTELTLKTVTEIEELAEEILVDRAQIVDYDRKRNNNREALTAIKKEPANKHWFCIGNSFIKISHEHSKSILQNDQNFMDKEISMLQDGLKPKVCKLHELEGRSDVKGFNLKGANR